MASLKIGMVGSGGMGTRRAVNFSQLDGVKVSAIAARNPSTGRALAVEHDATLTRDWRDLLEGMDALVVATHNALHGEIALAALDAGVHVFCEYPAARTAEQCNQIAEYVGTGLSVLRLTHNTYVTDEHRALSERVTRSGSLLTSHFVRFTPGRGRRPEVLFNLEQSGPPALFFVYQVQPYVSLFGAAESVHCHAFYEDLQKDGSYHRFMNTMTVVFEHGGTGQWTWAGGVEIDAALQEARIVTTDATFIETEEGWDISTGEGVEALAFSPPSQTLEQLFLSDIRGETDWRRDALTDLEASLIGLAAERSADEGRVVRMDELRA